MGLHAKRRRAFCARQAEWNCFRMVVSERGEAELAKLIMVLMPERVLIVSSFATTIPVRAPGKPNLDKLRHTMVLSFQKGLAGV